MWSYSPPMAWVRNGKPVMSTSGAVVVPASLASASPALDSAIALAPKSAPTSRARTTTRVMTSFFTPPILPGRSAWSGAIADTRVAIQSAIRSTNAGPTADSA